MQPQDSIHAPDPAQPPSPLGVYCECLAIISELPPHERAPVAESLAHFASWKPKILADNIPDHEARAAKLKRENTELRAVVDDLRAELYGEECEDVE